LQVPLWSKPFRIHFVQPGRQQGVQQASDIIPHEKMDWGVNAEAYAVNTF
jgi:hypothetical protein